MNRICARVINKADIPTLIFYIIETLYYLELYFSLSIFDIIEHSLIHLVDDLEMCSPVGGGLFILKLHPNFFFLLMKKN